MSTPKTTLEALPQPSSTYASLITQTTVLIPSFTLESGPTLTSLPVSYKTWGRLNSTGTNCMVICHALTGSADVEDWWGPLLGKGKAFDPTRYFIFCANVIGSPYGTVSSVTVNPETGKVWGPELAGSCPKDDVRLHKLILDSLNVTSISVVIGGSMGGMTTLEYALNTPPGYVKHIIPLATSARHSAWCISWGEAQRQSIYSDPAYDDGYYCYSSEDEDAESDEEDDQVGNDGKLIKPKPKPKDETDDPTSLAIRIAKEREKQPTRGLAAARMAALLTYRSRDSFESRFGRKYGTSGTGGGGRGRGRRTGTGSGNGKTSRGSGSGASTPVNGSEAGVGGDETSDGASTPREDAWKAHNDGLRQRDAPSTKERKPSTLTNSISSLTIVAPPTDETTTSPPSAPLTNLELSMPGGNKFGGSAESKDALGAVASGTGLGTGASRQPQVFSAQSYLRYQGDKFTSRFDANCYIHITRKMDMHDISHPSSVMSDPPTLSNTLPLPNEDCSEAEQTAALVHALSLLPPALVIGIETDGLFTTREQREIANSIPDSELVIIPSPDGHDGFLLEFEAINNHVSEWLKRKLPEIYEGEALVKEDENGADGFGVKKESLFGEAEADITRW